jgi:hypothetical protein
MKHLQVPNAIFTILFFSFCLCYADSDDVIHLRIKQSGFVGLEAGQVVHGEDFTAGSSSPLLTKVWQQRLLFQYVNEADVSERIRVIIAMECQLNYSYPLSTANRETESGRWTVYPDRAEGTYSCGDPGAPFLQFGFGYFPFRTDPDVQNLGEYLFRSGTYPLYVINTFNRPYARLLGLRATLTLFETLRQDFLLTSDVLNVPLEDWSFSYLPSYTIAKCVDIGGGIMFAHCFPTDNSAMTPTPANNSTALDYINGNGDTVNYTFKGTKVMARAAFDPKPLFPLFDEVMGKKDLRLYGELCVVGWQNQTNYDTIDFPYQYYNNRLDRTIWMVGANIPAFKMLDVLSLEFEYFPNRYPNSYQLVYTSLVPNPTPNTPGLPWKWSLYAKKTFLRNFAIIGQVARDHFVFTNSNTNAQIKQDVLNEAGDMWWVLRLNANF